MRAGRNLTLAKWPDRMSTNGDAKMGEKNHEQYPGTGEKKPTKQPSDQTLRGIGKVALGGATKPK